MLTFYECEYQTHRLIALYSGVCKVNGALAAQILIDGYQPDFILNGGTCGGLDENVDIFDTIVAERCIYHDVAEDILTDFHPWMKEPWFLSDEKLLRAAERAQVRRPLRFGAVATGEYFLGAGSRRRAAFREVSRGAGCGYGDSRHRPCLLCEPGSLPGCQNGDG